MKLSHYLSRRYVIAAVISFLFLIMIGLLAIRGMILRKAIVAVNSRISHHQMITHWDAPGFKAPGTVFVKGIYIKTTRPENEAYIDSITVKVKIAPLFLGRIRIKKIDCRSVSVRYSADSLVLDSVVTHQDTTDFLRILKVTDLAGFAYKNIRRFFNYTPAKVNFGRIEARYTFAGNTSIFELKDFRLDHGKMTAMLFLSGNQSTSKMPLTGKLDKSASIIELNVFNSDTILLPVPLLLDKYGVAGGFDSLRFLVNLSGRNKHKINIAGLFNCSGFELNGERLSTENIEISRFKSDFKINVGKDYIEVDSSTTAYLNKIRLTPYARYRVGNNPEITFKLTPETWDAGDFFSSLPRGMFTSLVGLKAEGLMHFYLNFTVNLNEPDSLHFETRLTGERFKVVDYGIDDYRILNGSFQHRVYERGWLVKSFTVGSENPDFVHFENISPFLRAAVMTSEDGSFLYHNGFNANAFRESIAANIKERRFARGGSTITMQLVKNVFLTRNKTLARKIEEALIVWLIETRNLVSKQRMYEVYLNIIEWGPGIYGINQAGRFYFDKNPADLNLPESVFLASIVPRPKWYKFSFEQNGVLRPFYGNYFNRMKDLMVRKEFISAYDTLGVRSDVLLNGNAALVFAPTDTAVVDSLQYEDLDIIPFF